MSKYVYVKRFFFKYLVDIMLEDLFLGSVPKRLKTGTYYYYLLFYRPLRSSYIKYMENISQTSDSHNQKTF